MPRLSPREHRITVKTAAVRADNDSSRWTIQNQSNSVKKKNKPLAVRKFNNKENNENEKAKIRKNLLGGIKYCQRLWNSPHWSEYKHHSGNDHHKVQQIQSEGKMRLSATLFATMKANEGILR